MGPIVFVIHIIYGINHKALLIITQPTIYRVIAYFSLYHELASDRFIVLDITWDYTMTWYPAQKIIYNGMVPISIDIRATRIADNVLHVHHLASTTHARTGP